MTAAIPISLSVLLITVVWSSSAVVVPAKHIVGAGLGRTGTMSFKRSIDILGLGPVFHMEDSLKHPENIPLWEKLETLSPLEKITNNDGNYHEPILEQSQSLSKPNQQRIQILSKIIGITSLDKNVTLYASSADFPTCMYFRDMIEVYKQIVEDPREVKVVLTSRSSGEKWASSFLDSIGNWIPSLRPNGISLAMYTTPTGYRMNRSFQTTFFRYFPSHIGQAYSTVLERKQRLAKYHDTWNQHVRSVMTSYAKENNIKLDAIFFEFQVQQGWGPLCTFLGIEDLSCPNHKNEPYPHVNDKQKYKKILYLFNIFGYVWTMILFCLVYYILQLLGRKFIKFVSPNKEGQKSKEI